MAEVTKLDGKKKHAKLKGKPFPHKNQGTRKRRKSGGTDDNTDDDSCVDTPPTPSKSKKKRRKERGNNSERSTSESESYVDTDEGGQPTELQAKIHLKIQECKGKRCKTKTREEIIQRRRDKKKNKKANRQKNKTTNKNGEIVADLPETPKIASKSKPTFNKDGKLVFSKFDFSEEKRHKNKSAGGLVGKDYKTILQRLEKRKEKIETLRSEDENAAHEMSQRDAWNVAISKAQGVKVKDDPTLVAKAARNKAAQDKRQKKKWKQRESSVAKLMKEKQEKRTKNIADRRQTKIDHKIKRSKKKGRVPGF